MEVFLEEQFCPTIQAELSQELGCEANIYIDEKDKQTVIFAYAPVHKSLYLAVYSLGDRCAGRDAGKARRLPL